ncbi:MAG: FAD-binding oxidoreductase [Candidatus Angelobacter sp. Gp1-AA117]|nr:MAG: FAD-binding oxidoreductase [Candidatus Angelobacter sp. Gp1-AA117]
MEFHPRFRVPADKTFPRDRAEALATELRNSISGEVRFDDGSRALYATDGSNYRQAPIGVVIPKTIEDVIQTVALARKYSAPILARGGGTSLAGQCCNVAVVIDFSKYLSQILEINPQEKYAWVQPGVPLDHLRNRANQYNLTFGPDPSTHEYCNLGGMIGNNSCGVHSMMAGRTVDNVLELDILTYDGLRLRVGQTSDTEIKHIIQQGGRRGEIYARLKMLRDNYAELIRRRYPKIPRRVSGYSLDELLPENDFHVARSLVGSESTCALTLAAKLRLIDWPKKRNLLVLGYKSIYEAGDHIPEVRKSQPIGLEGMDDVLINNMKRKNLHPEDIQILPEGKGWLLVEFGGETKQDANAKAQALMAALKGKSNAPSMKLFDDPREEQMVWQARESGLGATARVPGQKDTWEGWEDSAVPPEKLGEYLRELRKLFNKHGYTSPALYGHFGQACVHTRIDFDLITAAGIKNYRSFVEEAADLVVRLGGSLSGEHGDGQSRGELLVKMFGPELIEAFREFKRIWDPEWKMNPGKKIDPYRLDENLRLGADYDPPQVLTYFSYPEDHGDFAHVTTRCVGVGKCRKDEKGTMCPSYMVTKEEMHSTRGRTHLLFEMLQGDPMKGGWRSDSVREALDLCLACKACKGECPLNVDMATYKAEFLAHYYEGRVRPRPAYAMGLIYWWARLASLAPGLVNFFTQTPGLSNIVKALAGVAQERRMPRFASQTFKEWFRKRGVCNEGQPQVMLWPDTFNNHFHPRIAKAAVEVLEHAGYQVIIPEASLCCGRPLYDFGMLDTAKQLLNELLRTLRPHIAAGTPVIGLEPSCVSVFRDEMTNLLPKNLDAIRLKEQTFLLSEFLVKKANYHPPQLKRKAVVHGHCHHKSILKFDSEQELLKRTGLDFQVLDSGCCGMAGSFGFEAEKYDVSVQVGERVLLPAVRKAGPETLIIADGFSCFEQIDDLVGRKALHIAEVLQMAIREDQGRRYSEDDEESRTNIPTAALVGTGAALAGIALYSILRTDNASANGFRRPAATALHPDRVS